jgi:4-amino-4-deoxy-L-arabinose transferase-like glycosyltransferase
MGAFGPLLWMGCAYLVVRIIKTGNQKLWMWFGVLAGIGLGNKYSMGVFGFAVVVGLVLTKERKALASKWAWIAGLVAFLMFLPNLIWNIQNHWPFLELMGNIRASGRNLPFAPLGYIRAQILMMTPSKFSPMRRACLRSPCPIPIHSALAGRSWSAEWQRCIAAYPHRSAPALLFLRMISRQPARST